MGNETKGRREGEDCRKERRTKQKEKDHCFVTSTEGVQDGSIQSQGSDKQRTQIHLRNVGSELSVSFYVAEHPSVKMWPQQRPQGRWLESFLFLPKP